MLKLNKLKLNLIIFQIKSFISLIKILITLNNKEVTVHIYKQINNNKKEKIVIKVIINNKIFIIYQVALRI